MEWATLAGGVARMVAVAFGQPALLVPQEGAPTRCRVVRYAATVPVGAFGEATETRIAMTFLRSDIPTLTVGDTVETGGECWLIERRDDDRTDDRRVSAWVRLIE